MIHGENLILAINGTPLAASKSCSLSKSSSFIEVAPPTAGDWEAFVPSKKAWSMSSDCLLATMEAYETLNAAWKAGTALTISFYNTESDKTETGTAYIDKLDLQCAKNNLAKLSVGLKGSGKLDYYPATVLNINRITIEDDMHYIYTYNGIFHAVDKEGSAIKAGDFTLTKRTRVKIVANNNYLFLSRNEDLLTKATYLQDISATEYEMRIPNNQTRIMWMDAGTWYVVESLDDQLNLPTYTAIG